MVSPDRDPDAIWDPSTGETFAQALKRFETFGPLLTASQAMPLLALGLEPGEVMMSFGYGSDPVDFDEVTLDELADAIKDDGAATVDGYSGPFAIWRPVYEEEA